MKFRAIHTGNQTWEYFVGKSNVVIVSPKGKKHVVKDYTLLGLTPDAVERSRWKGGMLHAITPAKVKAYVEENLA